jgi:polyhydroxyalkanoate synthesis regulator phasin
MMEISQTSTALLGQSQAALVRQTEEVSDTMVEAGKTQARRARQAA